MKCKNGVKDCLYIHNPEGICDKCTKGVRTMQREYKFRGRAITGIWVYGGIAVNSHGTFINNEELPYDDCCKVIPGTVGQCTSLKDKNGKEIYEGDIIKISLGWKALVEWDVDNGRFLGFTIGNEQKIVYVGREPKAEVIGNIYENPELLKESD